MDIKVNFKGGGYLVNLKPKFSSDGESLYVCWNNSLFCYNTKTGKVVAEFKGVSERIIGFEVYNLHSYDFVMACLKNGEIIEWKAETRFRIRTRKLFDSTKSKCKIGWFHLLPSQFDNTFKLLFTCEYGHETKLCLFDINSETKIEYNFKLRKNAYVIGVGKNYFCVVQNRKARFVDVETQKKTIHLTSREVTVVACHPEEEAVLMGDRDGRIVLWQNIFSSSPTQAVFHWHTLPVRCVSFSKAGSCFYSGGEESVLVQWQISNNIEKKFLPRLPSTIVHVSVSANNTFLAVTTTDNGIRILDTRFNSVSLIQHLVIGDHVDCGIVFDPRTKALVMNGNIGQVQFYNPQDMSLLYKLDIVDQNKITNERNCKFENTQVSKMAISKTGMWLATVEERKDEEYTSERRLKFWSFNTEKQNFELNSSVDFPHEKSINNVQFRPTSSNEGLKCVTIGQDYKFKIWQLMDIDSIYRKGKIWNCTGEGFYRDLPCRGLSFAIDGSLIAIGFGPTVTTWLPDTCELKCSLTQPLHKETIQHLEFGIGNQCHLIVSASSEDLCVWNLLTLSMTWKVPLNVSLLIADHVTTNMAVITTDNKVFVFSPMSCEPVFASEDLLKDHNGISTATFVPTKYSSDIRLKWYQRSHIYFIDSDRELYSICAEEEYSEPFLEVETITNTLFNTMLSKSQMNENKLFTPTLHMYEKDAGHVSIKKYLDAPIHTMVPIRLTCKSLVQSLVVQKDKSVI